MVLQPGRGCRPTTICATACTSVWWVESVGRSTAVAAAGRSWLERRLAGLARLLCSNATAGAPWGWQPATGPAAGRRWPPRRRRRRRRRQVPWRLEEGSAPGRCPELRNSAAQVRGALQGKEAACCVMLGPRVIGTPLFALLHSLQSRALLEVRLGPSAQTAERSCKQTPPQNKTSPLWLRRWAACLRAGPGQAQGAPGSAASDVPTCCKPAPLLAFRLLPPPHPPPLLLLQGAPPDPGEGPQRIQLVIPLRPTPSERLRALARSLAAVLPSAR